VVFALLCLGPLAPAAAALEMVAPGSVASESVTLAGSPGPAATEASLAHGAQLFEAHCVGCHVGGGNIIRRGRTLKLQALQRNGLDSAAAIARVAAQGQGQMSGYREALGGDGGAADVAAWVWQQALRGWKPS
jgi:cytochrome c6